MQDWSLKQALEFVSAARPQVNPNSGFMAHLIRLEESLHGTKTVKVSPHGFHLKTLHTTQKGTYFAAARGTYGWHSNSWPEVHMLWQVQKLKALRASVGVPSCSTRRRSRSRACAPCAVRMLVSPGSRWRCICAPSMGRRMNICSPGATAPRRVESMRGSWICRKMLVNQSSMSCCSSCTIAPRPASSALSACGGC